MFRRSLRSLALSAAVLTGLTATAQATWSIVLVDTATGEVAIGCATCLEGLDLEIYVPVVLAGVGGACAQSSIDTTGRNRRYIWDELQKGTSPKDILTGLAGLDSSHQSRQYGIVDMKGRRITFTGSQCGAWAGGVAGKRGTIIYAIQGNVLTGQPVISDAEDAIRNTDGDLAERLMAGMEAAQADGGDGRCSCDPAAPTRCGSPPAGFDPDTDKSAHIGFMLVTRVGDLDGVCNRIDGCSNGSYYMDLNVANQNASDPDPVIQLRDLFDDWRATWVGRPDHIKSTKILDVPSLPANGTRQATLTVDLRDWQDLAVGHGGASITVRHAPNSAGSSAIGAPQDHGDGTYSIPLTAGLASGTDEFEVVVDDGLGPVTLYPNPTLVVAPALTASAASISASAGATIDFALTGPDASPPAAYLLLCSASGTVPGLDLGHVNLPLNYDTVLIASYVLRNTEVFVSTDGVLALDATAAAQLVVDPDELTPLVGGSLAFAFFTHDPVTFASPPLLLAIDD